MTPPYHIPVMLAECVDGLNINPNGTYVDITFGGGGHSKAILTQLKDRGRLFSFDQDLDARTQAQKIENNQFTFIKANFRYIQTYLKLHDVHHVDGILADLGISSYQIDTPERGFSTRFEGTLDMRMDTGLQAPTAANLLNKYPIEKLHRIFGLYGELKNARTVAMQVLNHRSVKPFEQISQLKEILRKLAPKGKENKFFAQVFQALRIEVNQEMEALEEFLLQTPNIMKPGARLVIMSYHSLEDRSIKNFIRSGKLFGDVEKDLFGNEIKPLRSITRKPIEASAEEITNNPRSRSAKLRIAERI